MVGDLCLRTVVEPAPIGSVAFPLTLVAFAATGRTKLHEAPAEPDQPEGTVAVRIATAIAHDTASAIVRCIKRMKFF